jgi:hypothetical protein
MGNKITPKVLYGIPLKDLAKQAVNKKDIEKDKYGATSQAKAIDNRMIYRHTVKIKQGEAEIHLNEGNLYVPSLLMQASILYNATNSLGTIYEKEYTPKDGRIHIFNNAFEHNGIQPRNAPPPVQIHSHSGIMREYRMSRPGEMYMPTYEETLIDNIRWSSLNDNPGTSILHSLGLGILPLLNEDETIEKSVFNFILETRITITARTHGTNTLMSSSSSAQPNTYKTGLLAQKRVWQNAFGVAGMPIVAERHEPLPSVEEDPGITGGNAWSRGAGRPGTTTEINAISIPGQRRVLGRMTKAERKQVFIDNLNVRRTWLTNVTSQPGAGTVTIRDATRNLQYAIPKGKWDLVPPDTDRFWTELDTVGTKNQPAEDEDAQRPAETEQAWRSFVHDELG